MLKIGFGDDLMVASTYLEYLEQKGDTKDEFNTQRLQFLDFKRGFIETP